MREPDFVFRRLHVTRQHERPDGNVEEEAVTPPVCDCCFDKRVRWEVDCEEFQLEEFDFASTNGWALCDVCADLTRERRVVVLAHRIAVSWAITRGTRQKTDFPHAILLVREFFDHITGDVRPFG